MASGVVKNSAANAGGHFRLVPRERSAVEVPSERPDLAALVTHYQEALRLRDWRLDVSYAPDLVNAAGRPVWGLCIPTVDAKTARIIVRDPSTPPDGCTVEEASREVVETLVHELVHLHFAPFANASPTAIAAEEQAVWAIAEALISSRGTPLEATYARAVLGAVDAFAVRNKSTTEPPKMSATLSQKSIKMLIEASSSGDKKLAPLASAILAELLGADAADPDASTEDAPPPAGDGGADEATETPPAPPARVVAPLGVVVPLDVSGAFGRAVLGVLGKKDEAEGLAELTRLRAIAVDLEARERATAADAATLEASERSKLVGELVRLGAETPHTSGLAQKTICARLTSEPIGELRSRVAALSASKPAGARVGPVPPVKADGSGLTEEEIAKCKAKGVSPEAYAKTRDAVRSRSAQETSR